MSLTTHSDRSCERCAWRHTLIAALNDEPDWIFWVQISTMGLTTLLLYDTCMGDAACLVFAKMLRKDALNLQTFSLRCNRIGDLGAQALGIAVQVSPSLLCVKSILCLETSWFKCKSKRAGSCHRQEGKPMPPSFWRVLFCLFKCSNQMRDAGAQAGDIAVEVSSDLLFVKSTHSIEWHPILTFSLMYNQIGCQGK